MAVLRISYFVMFFSALLWAKGESCSNGVYPESGFALVDHVFKSLQVDHLVSCYISCSKQPSCQSLNYNLGDKTCQLNNDTKYFQPKYFVEKPTFVYADNPSSGKFLLFQTAWKLKFHYIFNTSPQMSMYNSSFSCPNKIILPIRPLLSAILPLGHEIMP